MNGFSVYTLYIVHMNYDVILQQQLGSTYTTEVQLNESTYTTEVQMNENAYTTEAYGQYLRATSLGCP